MYGDAGGVKNSSEKLDNELHVKVKKRANNICMCFLFSQSIIHRVSAIKRHILAKIFTRCSKKMSAIANVRYIEVFPWKFDRDSAGSLKKCPLLPDVRYIAYPLYKKSTTTATATATTTTATTATTTTSTTKHLLVAQVAHFFHLTKCFGKIFQEFHANVRKRQSKVCISTLSEIFKEYLLTLFCPCFLGLWISGANGPHLLCHRIT